MPALPKELWAGTVLWRAIGRDAREDNSEFRNNVECERTVSEGFCGETNVAYSIVKPPIGEIARIHEWII